MKAVASALLACLLSSVALSSALLGCSGRFAFDVPGAGGSMGGARPHAGSAGISLGEITTSAGAAATSDCGARAACPPNLRCVDGQCYECAADSDCLEPGLGHCAPELHRCVACLTASDCGDGFSCDTLASHCLQTCYGDHDCPADAHGCDEHRRVCYECDEDQECSRSTLGRLCAVDGSGCVQCRNEADCPEKHCDQLVGRCVECRDWRDCDSGLCDPESGVCSR